MNHRGLCYAQNDENQPPWKAEGLPFGKQVRLFCVMHNMKIKQFAENAGVNYQFLLDVMREKTPGHELVPKVSAYMNEYENEG